MFTPSGRHRIISLAMLGWLLCASLLMTIPVSAQEEIAQDQPPVQALTGVVNAGEVDIFRLPGLKQGQTLYAYAAATGGNLDPIIALLPGSIDPAQFIADFQVQVQQVVQTSAQPILDLNALRDQFSLAWDDDSGAGYAAALTYAIPEDGDYYLLVSGSLSAGGRVSYGSYRLLLGLDAPQVLSGQAEPGEAVIAIQDETGMGERPRIQETVGTLGVDKPSIKIRLYPFDQGDTLSVSVEATSGDLKPVVLLRDFGGKPLVIGNLSGQASSATLDTSFPEGGENYYLEIAAASTGGQITAGDYRLLAGVNLTEPLSPASPPNAEDVLRLPIDVSTGMKLQQIVMIDQSNEIMTTVGTLRMEWQDPYLSFSPDECNCSVKEYTENSFNQFLTEYESRWPVFTFFNQQGNRWAQNRIVEVYPDGRAVYLERFTTNVQLNFDFAKFPFDTQDFYIKLDLLPPEDQYRMVELANYSEIDPDHGEDEFILSDFDTSISSELSSREFPTSRYTFHFSAPRHLEYYIFRILVPVLLIISISYVTFFLKDFTRRIEVATGNLLLFIAFSFSLAENYPRMGYLTFLDAIMAITFIINTLVVIYNVYLKWLEGHDQRERADRIDRVGDWIYPIAYLVSFALTIIYFF